MSAVSASRVDWTQGQRILNGCIIRKQRCVQGLITQALSITMPLLRV